MASIIKRGLATVTGFPGSIDVIVYQVQQTGTISQEWEEEVVKDAIGFDAAWAARNEKFNVSLMLKVAADTNAHAVSVAFLAPYAVVTLSGFDIDAWNDAFQVVNGQELSQSNEKTAEFSYKLRKYADSDQNTAATTEPS